MCYRCEACQQVTEPGTSRVTYVLTREVVRPMPLDKYGRQVIGTRTEVVREVPVCRSCQLALDSGISLNDLKARHSDKPQLRIVSPPPSSQMFQPQPYGRKTGGTGAMDWGNGWEEQR